MASNPRYKPVSATVNLTSGGTAQQIVTTENTIVISGIIQADPDNAGDIFIGDSTITNTNNKGLRLSAGQTLSIELAAGGAMNGRGEYDLSELYFDGTTNDDITILYFIKR